MTERADLNPTSILRLFGLRGRRAKPAPADGLLPSPRSAGVYVDIENLKDAEHARTAMETVVSDWPAGLPPVRRLRLYAPADKVGLWGAWAPARFPDLEVDVRGIQRFARGSKNAADMAIVADAVADFTTGLVNHVAVVTNDSDFGALFVKIQELASRSGRAESPPFLWINTPGGGGLSSEISEFVPDRLRWSISSPTALIAVKASSAPKDGAAGLPSNEKIAEWVLGGIPPGKFRAEDVRRIVQRRCPSHPAARTTSACGSFLAQQLMPILKKKGIRMVRQNPRTYERVG